MNRRTFTLAGFFGTIGASISKALAWDSPVKAPFTESAPLYPAPPRDSTVYAIKVGRKIMVLPGGPLGEGGWGVYSAVKSLQHQGDVLERVDDDGTRHYSARRLAGAPADIKRWSEASAPWTPKATRQTFVATATLESIREELTEMAARPQWAYTEYEQRQTDLLALAARIDDMIRERQNWCDGHNGPGPGLTLVAHGRRLCPYCLKQETDNVDLQLDGNNRGQAPSS